MPETTPETAVAEDLDQRVETLLKQMETAADQAAGIAAEVEAQAAAVAVAEPPTAAEADLASQVDRLLADAAKSAGDPSAPEAPQTIGSLDDELAKIASDLMDGDFDGEAAGPPVAAVVARAPAEPAPAVAAPPPDPTLGDRPVGRAQPAPAPAPETQAAPVVPAKPAMWRRAAAVVVSIVSASAATIGRHAPTLLALLEPVAFRIASLISMPLRNRPALVRDAVGWVAVGTTFWASCLFAYFLFLYEPDAPHPTSAAVGLSDPAHAEVEEEHAPAEAEHKEEPAADHGGGGEHGEAKKKEEHKPALKRPDKDPLNRPAEKKAEKKSDGHGESSGGH